VKAKNNPNRTTIKNNKESNKGNFLRILTTPVYNTHPKASANPYKITRQNAGRLCGWS
jgi:hypothetical protein